MSFKRSKSEAEKTLSPEEQQTMIGEVRKIIGPIADKFSTLCSDASVLRYLRARNYNTKKAAKMLKGSIKWRLEFKPEKIQWDDVAQEAERGRLYKADYMDKQGRIVFVIRPGIQMVKPFLEPKTYKKVIFVYPDNPRSRRMVMEEHLDMDKLESYFGGKNTVGFNYEAYAQKMKEDDRSMSDVFDSCCSSSPGFLSSEFHESV
ncbi:hypothetical protein GYH30_005839 [Glycine max]|nr:hypothetical protein GYH30_005839 [Glycine max]KAH1068006.1 hypothetical protein GYH30_005839 [Glycine max]KAH1068007.1 hypothetical protein GYH30_005839 [Glycine max]KAH1068010.1 hypothetical protein GYH30_005839 [Glycine max]KAH1068011.1 hypothetical protein GYH30_005839 [Glycine max]